MDNISLGDKNCPNCGSHTCERSCDWCEDGASGHECGEDVCCCLNPMANVRCDDCLGKGWHNWCPTCGWDLHFNQFLNGRDERQPIVAQDFVEQDCHHEFQWVGGSSSPYGPTESELVCRHCGAAEARVFAET